nr:MAG TPA: helix-turn-helix domain protein [Caudoviricetes sp.]
MTGQELKARIAACGISQSEIARRLGMSQQSFNQGLNVPDIRTGLLERIAEATGKPLSYFYPAASATITNESSELHVRNNSGVVSGTNNGSISAGQDTQKLVEMLVEANAKKDQQIDKLIALLSKQQ